MRRWADWFFRDPASGRIVVGQWPNLPLWLFALARLVQGVSTGETARWAAIAASLSLAIWAGDELVRGVNPWRRCLGVGVLAWLAVSTFG